ncbi:MAG: 2,4'-dihydroxyacetophenone dioxygenase family protein [Planctomycetaceae bacterium]|nr:2,4'-dihydroxyacetophenone dioxygenase family protein [Planctomycetaceae bacterium]MBV8315147.1 2,4'-dihydroxyacetophenone dioxygenase family protein [Planctomycetaceae bacterium]MBV8381242.1 2,4'-dihydroxyacetophenone dioxygenase family protein [Planctomycetaceae bacterium]
MMSVQGLAPLHRNSRDLPWVPFTPYSTTVKLKLLQVNPVTGQVITMFHVPGGEVLGVHDHHGAVIVYTVQGAWRYLEHQWTARAGDLVYETAGSRHTFLAEPGEDMVAFIVIEGALEFLDPQGHSMGTENWKTFLDRYYRFCEENHLRPVDLSRFE